MRQIIEAIPFPKQQRRPLSSLLSLSFFYGVEVYRANAGKGGGGVSSLGEAYNSKGEE